MIEMIEAIYHLGTLIILLTGCVMLLHLGIYWGITAKLDRIIELLEKGVD